MRRNRREAGQGQAGCLVGIIFLLAAIFVAYKLIPVKVKAADLRETVTDEAKQGGSHGDDRIRKAILEKAQDQGLPVSDENISIERVGSIIRVDVDYTVPVAFPGYTYQWHFHHHAENPVF